MKLDDLTPEEIEDLNDQTRAELESDMAESEAKKSAVVSSAIQKLISVTESETTDVVFEGPAGSCTVTVMVSPPQKIFEDLMQIANRSESGEDSDADQGRMCEILEYVCVEPKISKDVWMSGQLSDEIPARIIVELMKHKVSKHEEMESELKQFRPDERRSKDARVRRAPKNATEPIRDPN